MIVQVSLTPGTNSTPPIPICLCLLWALNGLPKIIKHYQDLTDGVPLVKVQGVLLYSQIIHMIVGFNFHSVLHHLIIIGDVTILGN